MPSLLVVVAVAMLMLQSRTLFLPRVNSEKVDLIEKVDLMCMAG